MSKKELDNIVVTQEEFIPFRIQVSNLETKVNDVMTQVSNHLPHQIEEVKQSIFEKLEDNKKVSALYLDNKINSHTRDILDSKYADKETTESFITSTKSLAKEIFTKIFWMLLIFFFGIIGTFIGITQYLNR